VERGGGTASGILEVATGCSFRHSRLSSAVLMPVPARPTCAPGALRRKWFQPATGRRSRGLKFRSPELSEGIEPDACYPASATPRQRRPKWIRDSRYPSVAGGCNPSAISAFVAALRQRCSYAIRQRYPFMWTRAPSIRSRVSSGRMS
jgi:hypothetical protein